MSTPDDYRARARNVRQAARAQLAEIRAQRAARSGRPSEATAGPSPRDLTPTARSVDEAPRFTASANASIFAADVARASAPPEPSDSAFSAPEAEGGFVGAIDPEPAAEATVVAEGGLGDLPGIGPGLVWILERSGVTSLADLAACDVDQLRERVGFLGSLVNVEAWVRFAREQTGTGTV